MRYRRRFRFVLQSVTDLLIENFNTKTWSFLSGRSCLNVMAYVMRKNERLITFVSKHPELYNGEHGSLELKNRLWREVARSLNISSGEVLLDLFFSSNFLFSVKTLLIILLLLNNKIILVYCKFTNGYYSVQISSA